MHQSLNAPGELEIFISFNKHIGPRCIAAGLGLQFHYNQTPGIHLKASISEEYKDAVLKGIEEGLSPGFRNFQKPAQSG